MPAHPSIALAALIFLLSACTQAPAPQGADNRYRIGGANFAFADDVVLQTWPIMPKRLPQPYARVALQMTPQALGTDLPADGRIQIDVLAPLQSPAPAGIVAASFADWTGREAAPIGSSYHYDPRSQLQADGGKRSYQRVAAPAGLIALEPSGTDSAAPRFFLHLTGAKVDRIIECRSDVPPSKNVGEYCALRPEAGDAFGYRIFFPRALLPQWQALDAATQAYLSSAQR